jgi:hypothetical protein
VFIEEDLAAWLRGQYMTAASLPTKIGKEQPAQDRSQLP